MPEVDPRARLVPTWPSRSTLGLAGALTGAAGVLTSQAAAMALRAPSGPVPAVAAAVRDLTPGPLAVRLVHLVGSADKPLLLLCTTAILLGICAWAGTLTARHPLWPDLVFVALTGVGLAAVLRAPHPGTGSGLALLVGLITWIVVLRLLTGPLLGEDPADPSRRGFLVRSGLVLVGSVAVAGFGRIAAGSRRQVEQARRLLRLPITQGVVPAGAAVGVEGVQPWRTPTEDFYLIDTALAPPSVAPAEWELRVHGMVEREVRIGYRDLLEFPQTEAWVTLACVSNQVGGDLIGNAWWSGALTRDVLERAGVHPDANAVLQTSADKWTCGTPLNALTDDRNALLAVAMNGQPLPVEHGFPVRTVVPGLYGYVSATKWVVDWEVTRFDRIEAYWTKRGWSEKGPVKTQSRIDVPRNGSSVDGPTVEIGGSAWAQHTGIEQVEYQLDGGPWRTAQLGTAPGPDTWVQWTATVQAAPGGHILAVRATNADGRVQTAVRRDVTPNGATGWHTVRFHVAQP